MSRINPFPETQRSSEVFPFASTIMAGIDYTGGFYSLISPFNNFSTIIDFGITDVAIGGHLFIVTGEVPVDEVTITITGTSVTDELGPAQTSNFETIVIPALTPVNTYFQTDVKWICEIQIETTSGTPINCNYGGAKYWDNLNRDFTITAIEATWMGGAADTTADLHVIHHKATGWTYTSGSAIPPAPIFSHKDDYGVASATALNIEGAWKRTGLTTFVEGTGGEGIFIGVTSSIQKSFDMGMITIWLES